jgi:hypothetical protein
MIKLVKRVPLTNKRIKTVCLPGINDYKQIFNKNVTLLGWYKLIYNLTLIHNLKEFHLFYFKGKYRWF